MIKRSLNQRSIAMIVGTAIAIESAIGLAQVPPARPIRLLIDEGHNNFHTSSGGYAGLTRLLRQDGFSVASHGGAITREALLNAELLMTASPLPEPREVLLRKSKATGEQMEWSTAASQPAYSPEEVAVVQGWVRNGGSLMLVLDHAPYGITGGALAAAFGVSIANATAFDTAFVKPTPLQAIPGHFLFTRDAGLLGTHPIVSGLTSIVSYTGSSLNSPPEAAVLLRLPSTANQRVWNRERQAFDISSAAGRAQAAALDYGRGRVVVLAEAGLLTTDPGSNLDVCGTRAIANGAIDNRQFALNVARWLARVPIGTVRATFDNTGCSAAPALGL